MKKCVDKKDNTRCHKGYTYDSTKNECVKDTSQQCPPGQEYRKNIGCVIKCRNNEKYNPYTKKCEPTTMNCQKGYRYDKNKNKCVPIKPINPPQRCRYQYNKQPKLVKLYQKDALYKDFILQLIKNVFLNI